MEEDQKPALNLSGDLWRFALTFYGREGVSDACLKLQDEAGVDVVRLIVILYADSVLKRRIDAREMTALHALMTRWREETVLPLRALRRQLKSPPKEFPAMETQELRDTIKKAEFRAEQIQLAIAEQWLASQPAREGMALKDALALLPDRARNFQLEDFSSTMELVVAAARSAAAR